MERAGLVATATTSQRSYGSTNKSNAVMLTVVDRKVFKHAVMPGDTLQGLAIKYGVSVEIIKRINKLWSGDDLHIMDVLLIPPPPRKGSAGSADDYNTSPRTCRDTFDSSSANGTDADFHVCAVEGEEDGLDCQSPESSTSPKNASCTAASDSQSDVLTSFNAFLTKIDQQIIKERSRVKDATPESLPDVCYDSYQHLSGLGSPTKHHPYLEQGI